MVVQVGGCLRWSGGGEIRGGGGETEKPSNIKTVTNSKLSRIKS